MSTCRLTIWSQRLKHTRKRSSSLSTTVWKNSVSLVCLCLLSILFSCVCVCLLLRCPLFHGHMDGCFGHMSFPPSAWTKLSVLSGLSSLQISTIAEELARKTEDASRQQEEITHLLSQIVDLQKKAKSVSTHGHTRKPIWLTGDWYYTLCSFCSFKCVFLVCGGERGAFSTPGGS